jgi:HSP20 family protein
MARIYVERRELPPDLQALLDVIWDGGAVRASTPAEFTPAVDVLETEAALEVVVDLPGVTKDSIQIVFSRNVLIVAGEKLPPAREHADAAFHLAERGFGRFARAMRLDGAYDAGRAKAALANGELRVTVPRIDERRGREIRIPIG